MVLKCKPQHAAPFIIFENSEVDNVEDVARIRKYLIQSSSRNTCAIKPGGTSTSYCCCTGDAEKPLQTDLHHKAHIATTILIARIHLRHIDARGYLGGVIHTGRGRASFTLNALHIRKRLSPRPAAENKIQDVKSTLQVLHLRFAYIADTRGASL